MPVDLKDVMQLCSTLAEERNLRVAVKETVKGGLIAGVSTAIGGLLAGPVGLAIGGAVGGGLAYMCGKDKFKPLAEVIMEMSEKDKRRLYEDAMKVINRLHYTDLVTLMAIVQGNPKIYVLMMGVITDFCRQHMQLEILD